MKKIIVILMTIFLSGCFSPSSPEYREELHKLEKLVKNIKEENIELLRNNDFKTYDLDKLKEDIEILLKENFDKFDLEVKVKEKEINDFLDKDSLELMKLADEKGYKLTIDKNYWKNKTENVGNLLKINIFSLVDNSSGKKYGNFVNESSDTSTIYKNCDIFYNFCDYGIIYSSHKLNIDKHYVGYFFSIFVNKKQWENIKEEIEKVQDKWKRIKGSDEYEEIQSAKILEKYLSDYPKYKNNVAIIKLKFVKKENSYIFN